MFVLKGITYLLSLSIIFAKSSFRLNELINKIHIESDMTTVSFIGTDFELMSDFLRKNSDIQVLIITSLSDDFEKMPYLSILVVDVSLEEETVTPSLLENYIQILRVRKFVIVMTDSFEKLEKYFLFFEENKFTRIFGITNETAYLYFPFADKKIEQVQMQAKLPDPMKDLNGFVFRTTIERNIPRTFWYTTEDGQRKIGGPYGQIFLAFLRRHNASYEEIKLHNSSDMLSPGIINATLENRIDISMNAYGGNLDLDSTYPVRFGRFIVMVPNNGYVDPNEYFERPFSTGVWIMVFVTLVYITLMDIFFKKYCNKPVDLWESFSQTYLALIGLPREKAVTEAYRVHIQIFALAFVLVNIYVIWFTSFLTVYIQVKQFETLKDLMDNNVKVMMTDFIWKVIEKTGTYPTGLEKIVVPMEHKIYLREMYSMKNTSFSYALSADTSDLLINLQQCFRKPLFHNIRNSLLEYNLGYTLVKHSPFKEILSDFIFDVLQTGLVGKWDLDVVVQARYAGVEELSINRGDVDLSEDTNVALTVHHLIFCWNLLAIGWSIATFVFLGEKFVKSDRMKNVFIKEFNLIK